MQNSNGYKIKPVHFKTLLLYFENILLAEISIELLHIKCFKYLFLNKYKFLFLKKLIRCKSTSRTMKTLTQKLKYDIFILKKLSKTDILF